MSKKLYFHSYIHGGGLVKQKNIHPCITVNNVFSRKVAEEEEEIERKEKENMEK